MLLGKYRFVCTLQDDAELPLYKGSTFRGAFGGALKKVMCVSREKDCTRCLLSTTCLYTKVFESANHAGQVLMRQASPPPPYVIEPDLNKAVHFVAGTEFGFNLLLFGEANAQLPYFVYAVDRMGRQGIGRQVQGRRARFHIRRVTSDERLLYDGQSQELVAGPYGAEFEPDFCHQGKSADMHVALLTPLRLKYDNRLQAALPFHLLVRALLRRISGLFACYGKSEPALDYRGLVARAKEIGVGKSNLDWCDWRRYSSRQEQSMLMGGLIGNITYRDVPAEYLPLLELGSLFHLGKQTSFGLGAIACRWER